MAVSDTVILALIVAVPAMLSPLLLAVLTNRNQRRVKLDDYARQDVVAARLIASNDEIATTAKATAEKLGGQLQQIHTLVNSNLTAEMQARLEATRGQLVLMTEVIDLKRVAGHEPTEDASILLGKTKSTIAELEATLADRLKQTTVADAEAAGSSAAGLASAAAGLATAAKGVAAAAKQTS